MSAVLARLQLELHPEKTRLVDLSRGREGFDFLGLLLKRAGSRLRPGRTDARLATVGSTSAFDR